uniref:Calcipressin n=1 Tax=Arion vulgaris TaxID=1028688 RepID=A0A0B6Z155_9EUPU
MSELNDSNDSVESMDDMDLLCEDMDGLMDMTDTDDTPSALIITNIDPIVFIDPGAQATFEHVFRDLDKDVSFIYLKNFKRARLQFSSTDYAAIARIRYDGVMVCGQSIRCYFIQPRAAMDNAFLRPPQPKRMFLISPPSSPPVGWESVPEAEPVINFDLLHAIARLNPGETHEVQPPSVSAPSIVVHLCPDADSSPGDKAKIIQTRRPDAE